MLIAAHCFVKGKSRGFPVWGWAEYLATAHIPDAGGAYSIRLRSSAMLISTPVGPRLKLRRLRNLTHLRNGRGEREQRNTRVFTSTSSVC